VEAPGQLPSLPHSLESGPVCHTPNKIKNLEILSSNSTVGLQATCKDWWHITSNGDDSNDDNDNDNEDDNDNDKNIGKIIVIIVVSISVVGTFEKPGLQATFESVRWTGSSLWVGYSNLPKYHSYNIIQNVQVMIGVFCVTRLVFSR